MENDLPRRGMEKRAEVLARPEVASGNWRDWRC